MSSPSRFAGQKPMTPEARHPFLGDELIQQGARILVDPACGFADDVVFEDRGVAADQIPGGEERRPIDVGHEFGRVSSS